MLLAFGLKTSFSLSLFNKQDNGKGKSKLSWLKSFDD